MLRVTAAALALSLLLAACGSGSSTASRISRASGGAAEPAGTLRLSSYAGPVGTPLVVEGSGFAPGETLRLVWETVDGYWQLSGGTEFVGARYTPVERSVGTVRTDAQGRFQLPWTVPEDFGGQHLIKALPAGETGGAAASGSAPSVSFEVQPRFTISATRAAVGETLTIHATGIGSDKYQSLWEVAWDNGFAGILTAVSTHGSAEARLRVAGPPGAHLVQVWRNFLGFPYLNPQQGPHGTLPDATWLVEVTPASSPVPVAYSDPTRPEKPLPAPALAGARPLAVTPGYGPVETPVRLEASGLPAGAEAQVVWTTQSGNRVSSQGHRAVERSLGTVRIGGDGRLDSRLVIPDDLGGTHVLSLRVGDRTVAVGAFVIQPSIVSVTPSSGPAGTRFTIHLKGVGWAEYDNTYALLYDDHYLGYACGFNTSGDVQIVLTASGAPGVHLIDLVPVIYQGQDAQPVVYTRPQLTYGQDHPGRTLPALHLAFTVTGGSLEATNP
ncbi:MAG: hypothetical protein QJR08_02825 [Bacillota bacterium]|nr:hypothetical protein [Bacillota bacterium]